MKTFFLAFLFSLIATLSYAQEEFTLNQGGTSQKNYYAEIEYENANRIPIIKATIHGKEYRFLLDTGAPNAISKALFDELKPNILKRMPIWDANNKVDSLNIVSLNEITVGNIIFNDIPSAVPKDPFIFDCLKVDGSIGSNMLRNSILHISSKTHKIILTDQSEKLNLNREQSTDLFLTPIQSNPAVKVNLISKDTANIQLLFDTGMAGLFDLALNHFVLCEKENIVKVLATSKGSSGMAIHGIGRDTTQYRLRIPQLDINGAILKNVDARTTEDENSRIGSDLLNFGLVTVDYKNKKFYFDPFATPIDLHAESFPISLMPKDNKVVIGMVWDETLKDKINVNEQVLAIDDVDYTNISTCDFMLKTKLYESKAQAILTLKTPDGTIKKVTIKKK